ncbi:MAG: M24 family metallopeptidase [Deltaproteobacteria bacterium]|nr:M24 family metallopeptidase [Deltaproteobacteria bacterium]MBI3293334.1 M24 family metallopeptidase [Deltaproteobacteria bacterium]
MLPTVERLYRTATKVQAIPGLHYLVPPPNVVASDDTKAGFLECQRLAQEAVKEVASCIRPGWTELQTADLIETYLRDQGVPQFFHKPYVWFGDRSRFDGIGGYAAFMPTARVLREAEPFILDVAPILKGFISDIGYSDCLGENKEFEKAVGFLKELRQEIPTLFVSGRTGGEICREIESRIEGAGYENRHRCYPFGVIGHRVHRVTPTSVTAHFLNFGWQSFWSLLSRGLLGQLFNGMTEGDLTGLWAIEPHIGAKGFGAKFEEILVVENGMASWLEGEGCY